MKGTCQVCGRELELSRIGEHGSVPSHRNPKSHRECKGGLSEPALDATPENVPYAGEVRDSDV